MVETDKELSLSLPDDANVIEFQDLIPGFPGFDLAL